VKFSEFGFTGVSNIRDLWKHTDLGTFTNEFNPLIHLHGAGLYRISPKR